MPTVWIVPHTHWDREWHHRAARFQARLARLIDGALAGLEGGSLPAFLLDGQGVVLDDYAALRPEGVARLSRALKSGTLQAGPWYVLPDELLVSAEALVRNLQIGSATVRRYGGEPVRIGYSPDAFGHSAMLPAVLTGFGITSAIVWRGFAGKHDLYRWRAPSGAEVLMIHLPRPGYEYGANLPAAPAAAARRWRELRALLGPRARTPHWLVLNGADHHAPQPDLPAALRALRRAGGATVKAGTLEDYVAAVERSLGAGRKKLTLVEGELRDGRAHTWALQDTHGTRLYLKQLNAQCQRLLERVTEPLAALAALRGAGLTAELRAAWRALLENHAHDSICGTSHDAVHDEMVIRFGRCRALALEGAARALDVITGRDPDAAREAGRKAWRPQLHVFNTAARPGRRLVEANVALYRRDIPVGPGSAARRARPEEPGTPVLRDARGRVVPYQLLERGTGVDLMESPRHYPDAAEVVWHRVLFEADLPSLGVTSFSVRTTPRPTTPDSRVRATATSLTNEHLQLTVAENGTLTAVDLETREHYDGIGALEDQADEGDSYTSAPRGRVFRTPDHVGVRLVHAGPLRAQVEVVRRYDAIALDVTMQVVLEAGSRAAGLWLEGINVQEDHRLRLAFPTGVRRSRVLADAHFGTVERRERAGRIPGGERAAATAPAQRWIAAARGARGLAVINDGLPQYEVRGDGTILVTLLRSTGQLSKPDLPERPGHAGWPTATPGGQCLGPFSARLAFMLTGEAALATPDVFDAAADDYLVPPVAVMQRACLAKPEAMTGPAIEGDGLVLSAFKPAESGTGVVLRFFNARGDTVAGSLTLPRAIRTAGAARLDETSAGMLRLTKSHTTPLLLAPRVVATVVAR